MEYPSNVMEYPSNVPNNAAKSITDDISNLAHQCESLNGKYLGVIESSCDLSELPDDTRSNRYSNCSISAMLSNYDSETSLNTVISNPCSDSSSQNTKNSSECSSSSMDASYQSSECSLNADFDENGDLRIFASRISNEKDEETTGRRKRNNSSTKSSSLSIINQNIRKLLSKIKNKSNQKSKTKKQKSGSVSSSYSDDCMSVTTSLSTSSNIDWYANLFNDYISSESSDSEDEYTNTRSTKKTNIRGKISVDIEMHKTVIGNGNDRNNSKDSDNSRKLRDSNSETENTIELGKTKSSYATIRKTNTVELKKDVNKNRRKHIQKENKKNNLNNIDSMMRNSDVISDNDPFNDIDLRSAPYTTKYASYSSYTEESNQSDTRDENTRRSYSFPRGLKRPSIEQYDDPPKMIASFDFIAAEDMDVTVLTGQQVEVLVKPDPDWWWVRVPGGKEGFVPKNFLSVVPTVPSRKSDLIKKLMTLTYDPNVNIFDKPDVVSSETPGQVRLPRKIKFTDSPPLAMVAPLIRQPDIKNENECDVYKMQNDNECAVYKMQNDNKNQNDNIKRLPPPSYEEHLSKSQVDVNVSYSESNHSNETDDNLFTHAPRALRRRSFSGKQKKVHFANSITTAYTKDSPEYIVSYRYGLDSIVSSYQPTFEQVSWC